MSPTDLETLLTNIVGGLNEAADFAGVLDPALVPFVVIGKAVDTQLPGLVANVDKWIQGNPPTDAEKSALLQQLSVLGNPNLP